MRAQGDQEDERLQVEPFAKLLSSLFLVQLLHFLLDRPNFFGTALLSDLLSGSWIDRIFKELSLALSWIKLRIVAVEHAVVSVVSLLWLGGHHVVVVSGLFESLVVGDVSLCS